MNSAKLLRISAMKDREKIAMLTAYDYSMAAIESLKKVDMILVGDSANFILNGKDTTRGITVDEMVILVNRVSHGVKDHGDFSLVIGDLPAGSYATIHDAVTNAKKLQKAGADAVKLEGGTEKPFLKEIIKAILDEGIAVQGHIGYTPQSEIFLDKGHVQGKSQSAIDKLHADLKLLHDAGVFSIVLECVPWRVAQVITQESRVPTIGIGAGPYCDGQVLVSYDLLGLTPGIGKTYNLPKFVWQYACNGAEAIARYVHDVKAGTMPDLEHSYEMKNAVVLKKLA